MAKTELWSSDLENNQRGRGWRAPVEGTHRMVDRWPETPRSEHEGGGLVHQKLSRGGSVSRTIHEGQCFTIRRTCRGWLTGGLKCWEGFVRSRERKKWVVVK